MYRSSGSGPLEVVFRMKELHKMINHLCFLFLAPSSLPPLLINSLANKLASSSFSRKGQRGSTAKIWFLNFFCSLVSLVPPAPTCPTQLCLSHTALDPESNVLFPQERHLFYPWTSLLPPWDSMASPQLTSMTQVCTTYAQYWGESSHWLEWP